MDENEKTGCLVIVGIAAFFVLIFAFIGNKSTSSDDKTDLDSLYTQTDSVPPLKPLPTPSPTPPQTNPTRLTPHESTPDDPYDEGYSLGYDQGMEDGTNGHPHGYDYDETNDYHGDDDEKFRDGYEDGYEDGYSEGRFSYEEKEWEEEEKEEKRKEEEERWDYEIRYWCLDAWETNFFVRYEQSQALLELCHTEKKCTKWTLPSSLYATTLGVKGL